jgi:6-pyruvoyl-tetrahydropterin synthase related domain
MSSRETAYRVQESRHDWHRFAGPAVILIAAFVAVAPQLVRGNSCGHDFDFHLASWIDCLHSWREGILYPHWAPSPNFGAGEPRFVFYPPLTWMLGAALGSAMLWKFVPVALTFLFLVGGGLATRALARQTMANGPATLAGCAALFSGYAQFTAYERSAFGELTGCFWIPLLLLLIFRDRNPAGSAWRRAFDGSATPLALVVAGAWLSDAPLGVMTCYLLAAVTLAVALLGRSWAPVLRATAAVVVGTGLASLYLLPAAMEQHWVDLRELTTDPGYQIRNSWLFAHHANPVLQLHDLELFKVSIITVTMVAVALAGILVSRLRGTLPGSRRWWIPLAIIPVAVLFLQLPISGPVWDALPRLQYLQFPWRWLVVLEAPMAIFFASAVWMSRRWMRLAVLATCSLAALALTAVHAEGLLLFQGCDEDDSPLGMFTAYIGGSGFEGTDEYAPPYADNSLLAMGLPEACLTSSPTTVLGQGDPGADLEWSPDQHSCDATVPAASTPWNTEPEHLRIAATMPHAGYLILRLRTYPAWQVRLNGQILHSLPRRDDGLMAVPVPQGPVNLTVDWTTTPDVIAARWLAAFALALLTALCVVEKKLSPPRLE